MKTVLGALAFVLFVLAVPVLVFLANGLALVFDAEFYSRGEVEQQVDQVYGLPQRDLIPVNQGIVRYFGASRENLGESLAAAGADRSFFGERETAHMADVRSLVRLIVLVERVALAYGIVFIGGGAVLLGTGAVGRVGAALVAGGILAILVVVVAGVLAVVDFGGLFVRLHLLSFSNDFWMLDPRTDHLIQMFPFGFWRNTMLILVLRSLATSAAAVAVGAALVWLGRRLL